MLIYIIHHHYDRKSAIKVYTYLKCEPRFRAGVLLRNVTVKHLARKLEVEIKKIQTKFIKCCTFWTEIDLVYHHSSTVRSIYSSSVYETESSVHCVVT